MGEHGPGKFLRLAGRNGNLEAVLAGIAGARDDAGGADDRRILHVHEFHRRRARPESGENRLRLRALQGEQRPVVEQGDVATRHVRLHMGDVLVLAGGVDDDEEMIPAVGDHQVIENAAIVAGKEAVALAAGLKAEDVDRHELLEGERRILRRSGRRGDDHLSHVGDVKETGRGARMQVFLHHAERILHRHVVAGERHHPGAERQMQRMQRGVLEGRGLIQECLQVRHGRVSSFEGAVAPGS